MSKRRTAVPKDIAEEVIYLADFRCCVCDSRGHHIHHIDGDPTNNDFDNLALLCFAHHNEATTRLGLARGLTSGLLKRYRDDLYVRVAASRLPTLRPASRSAEPLPDSSGLFQLMLDAAVMVEVARIDQELTSADWPESADLIHKLLLYPSDIGVRARSAILSILYRLASQARRDMPESVSSAIVRVVMDLVPLSLYSVSAPTTDDRRLVTQAAHIGFSLAYDAALYTHRIQVVESGAEILWRLLAMARGLKNERIEQEILSHFSHAEDAARRGNDALALELLQFVQSHAQSEIDTAPDYPFHIIEALAR